MALTKDAIRLIPEGTTHFLVEERLHRGSIVWAVVAITASGHSIPMNGYSSRELAEDTARLLAEAIA